MLLLVVVVVVVMQNPEILVAPDHLDSLKKIDCQVGNRFPPTVSTTVKAKRKARSTRRRLNAMINNASLHFSDTDSEGELTVARTASPNGKIKPDINLLRPIISVTPDVSDDCSYVGSGRRPSFVDNATDIDEIYTSEPETEDKPKCKNKRKSLAVVEAPMQAETDLEDVSNDEDEVQPPIFVKPRSDILVNFNGETVTTKEGDGPFSTEIRNQMSFDEGGKILADTPDIVVMPTTDSEDMEASDDDDEDEAAAAASVRGIAEFDVDSLTAAQSVLDNVDKMEQQLQVPNNEDAVSDCLTDVEDIE